MKTLMFAVSLMLGSNAAFGQTGNTVSHPSQSSGPRGITQQGTDPEGQACTPSGFNAYISAYRRCGAGDAPAHGSVAPPPCSRTATDHCIQTYERMGGRESMACMPPNYIDRNGTCVSPSGYRARR